MPTPSCWSRRLALASAAVLAIAGLAGCSSKYALDPNDNALSGEAHYVNIDSSPQGALISVNGRMLGRTPTSVMMLVDEAEHLVRFYTLTAHFQAVGGGSFMEQYNVNDRAPRAIRFTPQEAIVDY